MVPLAAPFSLWYNNPGWRFRQPNPYRCRSRHGAGVHNACGKVKKMQKNELIIFYGTEYTKMTMAALEQADLKSHIPSKNSKIGIKINLVSESSPEYGATTHTEVVEGLIRYLQGYGYQDLRVMEGSWVGSRTKDVCQIAGYDRLCERMQVPFCDMQKDKSHTVKCHGYDLEICDMVDDIDFLINVPVLKGHCQTRMTCALKNMKGLIPNSEKRRFHRMGLHKPIGHLASAIHQDFILVDSICGDLMYEDGGNPVTQNRIIAALDPVLMDTWACGIVGVEPEDVPYIGIAAKLGVGSMDLQKARILTYRKEKTNGDWMLVPSESSKDTRGLKDAAQRGGAGYRRVLELSDKAEAVDSCSACYGSLIPALGRLDQEGLLEKLHEKICIGQGYQGKSGELGVGRCTAKFAHSLKGCPPSQDEMYDFLKNYILKEQR